jgi:hypothetical protein
VHPEMTCTMPCRRRKAACSPCTTSPKSSAGSRSKARSSAR